MGGGGGGNIDGRRPAQVRFKDPSRNLRLRRGRVQNMNRNQGEESLPREPKGGVTTFRSTNHDKK